MTSGENSIKATLVRKNIGQRSWIGLGPLASPIWGTGSRDTCKLNWKVDDNCGRRSSCKILEELEQKLGRGLEPLSPLLASPLIGSDLVVERSRQRARRMRYCDHRWWSGLCTGTLPCSEADWPRMSADLRARKRLYSKHIHPLISYVTSSNIGSIEQHGEYKFSNKFSNLLLNLLSNIWLVWKHYKSCKKFIWRIYALLEQVFHRLFLCHYSLLVTIGWKLVSGTRRQWPRPRQDVDTSEDRDVKTETTTLVTQPYVKTWMPLYKTKRSGMESLGTVVDLKDNSRAKSW